MKVKHKKWVASVLTAVTLCSAIAYPNVLSLTSTGESLSIVQTMEVSAVDVTKGCFNGNSWSGYTYVYSNNNRKSSQIKVCAFMSNGKIKSGKFKVEITTPEDKNFRVTVSGSGTKYITLNYGYSTYKIRIIRNGSDSTNVSRTRYWSIDFKKNCRKYIIG